MGVWQDGPYPALPRKRVLQVIEKQAHYGGRAALAKL